MAKKWTIGAQLSTSHSPLAALDLNECWTPWSGCAR